MNREDFKKYDLPDEPGIYIFRDKQKHILYVGKATYLCDRVRSYFGVGLEEARGGRIVAMIERATSLEWQTCGSVLEALILEANLIKKHQPPYNVDEKDDKSWNYVAVTKEDFPRVLLVRGHILFQNVRLTKSNMKTKFVFGPYPHGGQLKEVLKIVRRIFPYRTACLPNSDKPCFNRQIGLCPGVCSGEISKEEYARTVRNIHQLFSGNFKGLKNQLACDMRAASIAERFEDAGQLRKQIKALEHIRDVALVKSEKLISFTSQSRQASFRIEAFDTAHTAGIETVAVMVVVVNGEAHKSEYRKFIIKTAKNDDVASLKEALSRRLVHVEWPLPKLFVVDGGAPQVRAAQAILKNAGVMIPIIGVIKNASHKPERLMGDTRIIKLYERDILLGNAEAHRFANSWHRVRLRKRNFA